MSGAGFREDKGRRGLITLPLFYSDKLFSLFFKSVCPGFYNIQNSTTTILGI